MGSLRLSLGRPVWGRNRKTFDRLKKKNTACRKIETLKLCVCSQYWHFVEGFASFCRTLGCYPPRAHQITGQHSRKSAQKISSLYSILSTTIHFSLQGISHTSIVIFLVSFSGVRLSPLGTSANIWPIVPAPDDRWWVWSSRWNENWQGKPKYSEKTCPIATLSTTNPAWPDRGLNPGRRGGKPATNAWAMARPFTHQ
jgi:hypothetical protein